MQIDYRTIIGIIGILGTIFTVYNYFRNPQIKLEKNESVFGIRHNTLQADMTNLKDNHLHTMDVKMDAMSSEIGEIKVGMAKLATIIEERIPKKQ